jgi:hypothetical protein
MVNPISLVVWLADEQTLSTPVWVLFVGSERFLCCHSPKPILARSACVSARALMQHPQRIPITMGDQSIRKPLRYSLAKTADTQALRASIGFGEWQLRFWHRHWSLGLTTAEMVITMGDQSIRKPLRYSLAKTGDNVAIPP